MPAKTRLTMKEAMQYARRHGVMLSKPTIIKYLAEYDLGYQIAGKGSKWIIYKEKFRRFIRGADKNTNKNS